METFFLTGSCFDETELKELLLRRYHTLDFIKDLEIEEFIKFCNLAKKKEEEDRLHSQWCAMLPPFAKDIDVEEFRDIATGANIDMRPANEIIEEIEEIHRRKEGKR